MSAARNAGLQAWSTCYDDLVVDMRLCILFHPSCGCHDPYIVSCACMCIQQLHDVLSVLSVQDIAISPFIHSSIHPSTFK